MTYSHAGRRPLFTRKCDGAGTVADPRTGRPCALVPVSHWRILPRIGDARGAFAADRTKLVAPTR